MEQKQGPYGVVPWRNSVEGYSVRLLSHGTDVLPAIASLADRFVERIPGPGKRERYMAGLLWSELPLSLLWTGIRWDRASTRRPSYTAPTWSWASTEGKFAFSHLGAKPDEILDIATLPNGACKPADPKHAKYSMVVEGHIKPPCRIMQLMPTYFPSAPSDKKGAGFQEYCGGRKKQS